jgi:hypothetical protein
VALLLVSFLPGTAAGQAAQGPDSTFDPAVTRPAWARGVGPRVVIDEAHLNFHRAGGRFRPFAELLRNDGLRVEPGTARFTAGALAGTDVLVIANALGGSTPADASRPAFDSVEVEAVRAWVDGGGSLLLVADHEPFGAAAAILARRFGVDMSAGRTYDDPHSDWSSGSPSWLVYQRDTGALIIPHPVTDGRDSTERIRRVVTFTGQSLRGPPGSVAFLALAESAQDRLPDGRDVPAAGRAQGIAVEVGRGRVVVLGEAGMLTAQVATTGTRTVRFGLTWPDTDDRQLVLNVMRRLGRLDGSP